MNNPKVNVVVSGHRNEYHSTYKTYILRGGIPFADQVTMPDTKYVIKYDFNLGGGAFDLNFSNADTHTVAEVTYYYIPFTADGSKYTLMNNSLVFIDAEWNGLSAREIKPEKGTLFMIASITGGLYKNGYGINVVTVPENCILEFDGGSLDNGFIVGQDTVFINVGDVDIWGENLTREGTWREKQGGGGGIPDKEYDPEAHSGLGRKTLELDGDSNILTQDDFDQDNTIYVITYDFDLNGGTIEIPEGCILDFEGGSISSSEEGGKLIGDNTAIEAPIAKIFDTSIEFDGRWAVDFVYTEWFGAITDNQNFDCTDSIQAAIDFAESSYGNTVKFVQGIYWFTQIRPKFKTSLRGSGIGCSILRQLLSAECHAIYLDRHYSCFKLEDFTLVGNAPTLSERAGIVVPANRYSGIHLADVSSVNNGAPYYSYQEVKGEQTTDVAYKFCYINNILVERCGDGLYVGNNQFCVFVENSYFRESLGVGIIIKSTDCTVNNCYCEYNGLTGFDLFGSNNKISQIKSIFNGFSAIKDSAGISIGGRRNQITDCETQDNFCKGYFIWGQDNNIMNCISNTDGYGDIDILNVTPENYHYNASLLPYGFLFDVNNQYTLRNSIVNCKVTYYKDGFQGMYRLPFNIPDEFRQVDKSVLFDNISVPAIPGRSLFRTYGYCTENAHNSHNITGDSYERVQTINLISTDGSLYIDTSNDNISFTNGTTMYVSFKIKDITDIPETFFKEFIKFHAGKARLMSLACDFDQENTNEHRVLYNFARENKSVRACSIKNENYDADAWQSLITIAIYFFNDYVTLSGYYPKHDKDGVIEYVFFRTTEYVGLRADNMTTIEITNKVLLDKLIICNDSISETYLIPGAPMGKFRKSAPVYISGINYIPIIKKVGTTEERPTLLGDNNGFQYYDTTLKKLIVYWGNNWYDVNGNPIESQNNP